jgi:hypothetical protein
MTHQVVIESSRIGVGFRTFAGGSQLPPRGGDIACSGRGTSLRCSETAEQTAVYRL